MSEEESPEDPTFKTFQFGGPDTEPITVPGEDANIGDAINAFSGLKEAQRTARLPENEPFVSALEEAFREEKDLLQRAVALSMLGEVAQVFSAALGRAEGEGNREAFEQSAIFKEEDGKFTPQVDLGEKMEEWQEEPPSFFQDTAEDFIAGEDRWEEWAQWAATHVMYWAAEDLNEEIREEGRNPDNIEDEEWDRRFSEQMKVEEYFTDAVQILASHFAGVGAESMNEAVANQELSFVEIERLFGLHDDEDDTPAPRPETPEMTRIPFQGNDGKIGAIPAGPFVIGSAKALLKARGNPAETSNNHWGANSTGDPVYVDTLGDPYEGKAIYTVQGLDASRADMDAGLGWAILKEIGPDAVWTHLLLLAHASDPGRRGERSIMRIPRDRLGRALGLHKSKSYSARERYERAKKNIQALGSINVKFQNLRRHGKDIEFRGATTGSSLWNLDLVIHGQLDAFEGTGRVNWHLEATEGNWADKFLHDNESPQWTWLPVEWFDRIDRRRSEYARRLAPYLLFLFRAQANEGHHVRLSAETMLKICGEDLNRNREASQRTGLKNRLLDALDTLEAVYGIGVNDEEVNVKYIPWNDWKGRVAHFTPPEVIRGNLFRSEKPKPRPLPDPGGDWTAAQIRRLRDRLDMTQAELGEILDVSRHMVSLLENGHRNPSRRIRKTLDKLKDRC